MIGSRHSFSVGCSSYLEIGQAPPLTVATFLREIFFQRLPSNVRMVLASTGDTVSLEQLAKLADKIAEVATPSVSTVTSLHLTAEVDQLRTEVTCLQEVVKALSKRQRVPPRRSPTLSRPSTPSNSTLCWYHQKYGEAAQKCRPPCDKASNDQATQ